MRWKDPCDWETMSIPREPPPAKLVTGLLFRDLQIQREALFELESLFGPIDFLSPAEPFSYTSYYDREMGEGVLRQVAGFLDLVSQGALPPIKHRTNQLEIRLSAEGRRRINIDPGLLSDERMVLATGKNYTHRIYLREGIYADLTLIYQKGGFQVLPWTYPDYRRGELLHYLGVLRRKLIFQRRKRLPGMCRGGEF
ncbi:MAG: DUF4416 family protein [Syntrophobacteraceae bacterium]|nr:DUF4416 family protein [Syntrophobacteraceae bacterium]